MKSMIFAAGVGSRLKPWTDSHPKALVEVGDKPMLQRVIENIQDAGIGDIIINVHHFGEQVIKFVQANDFLAHISISDEREKLLDTGGGLLKAIPFIGEDPILVHNADIYTNLPLKELVYHHVRSGADVTLLTDPRQTNRRLVFDQTGRLKGWLNTITHETRPVDLKIEDTARQLSFDGIHILSPEALLVLKEYGADKDIFSITDFYIDSCHKLNIRSYEKPADVKWFDVGKPETLAQAREYAINHP